LPVAAKQQDDYSASSLTVLEGLEAVRKRPGMYIGSTGERGLHHLIWEVVDNSVDEALAGYCTDILVTLTDDGGVRVEDNGRGFPVDLHPKLKKPGVEVALTVLHAGGKFDSESYAVSGGLHGVGVSVVNALSTRISIEICRAGHVWRQDYKHAQPGPLEEGEPTDKTGTVLTFWPDGDIFVTLDFDYKTIYRRLQEMAFLNGGLAITLRDERPDHIDEETGVKEVTFKYDEGIADFVRHLNASKNAIHPTVVAFNAEEDGQSLEVSMQWNESYGESVYTLTNAVNKYGLEKKIIKSEKDRLSGDDIREGLAAIISVKLREPQFEGQTKTKLGNTEVKGFVQRVCNEHLPDWLDRHPKEARIIVQKASSAANARKAAAQARKLARRKSLLETSSMPGKLADCQSTNPEECEIFVVEGDSAGGSAKQGRNPRTQAIMPIRGKILNVEKARLDKILKNNEVQGMITALGTGIHEEFEAEKLRYHKVILMSDADVDGHHINTLLLTLLFRFMRPLIELGHVYMSQPPLYKIKWNKKGDLVDYAYSDAERNRIIEAGVASGKADPRRSDGVQRYKGLGEMNYTELWETTMDPAQRNLLQVQLDDAATADELFSVLMGEDVESRRRFIQENAKDVRFLDI
jgi:DNA gyrase subunit B